MMDLGLLHRTQLHPHLYEKKKHVTKVPLPMMKKKGKSKKKKEKNNKKNQKNQKK